MLQLWLLLFFSLMPRLSSSSARQCAASAKIAHQQCESRCQPRKLCTTRHSPATHGAVLCCHATQQPHDGHQISVAFDTLAMNLNDNGNRPPQNFEPLGNRISEYLFLLIPNLFNFVLKFNDLRTPKCLILNQNYN